MEILSGSVKKYISFISEYQEVFSKDVKFQKVEYTKFIVKCIAEFCKKNKFKFPKYKVHSQNSQGKKTLSI